MYFAIVFEAPKNRYCSEILNLMVTNNQMFSNNGLSESIYKLQ